MTEIVWHMFRLVPVLDDDEEWVYSYVNYFLQDWREITLCQYSFFLHFSNSFLQRYGFGIFWNIWIHPTNTPRMMEKGLHSSAYLRILDLHSSSFLVEYLETRMHSSLMRSRVGRISSDHSLSTSECGIPKLQPIIITHTDMENSNRWQDLRYRLSSYLRSSRFSVERSSEYRIQRRECRRRGHSLSSSV